MITRLTSRVAVLLLIVGTVQCSTEREQASTNRKAAAKSIVTRFVAAELAGGTDSAATRLYGCRPPSSDVFLPTTSASITDVQADADTMVVTVQYHVVGIVMIDHPSAFWPEQLTDTVLFRLAEDSLGTLRILCGPYSADHWSIEVVDRLRSSFSDESLTKWRSALADIAPLNPEPAPVPPACGAQDTTSHQLPFTAQQNADGSRYVWFTYCRAGFPYPYVPASRIPESSDFALVDSTTSGGVRAGDVAWWPDFVGIMGGPQGPVAVAQGRMPLAVMVRRYGPPRFYRRVVPRTKGRRG